MDPSVNNTKRLFDDEPAEEHVDVKKKKKKVIHRRDEITSLREKPGVLEVRLDESKCVWMQRPLHPLDALVIRCHETCMSNFLLFVVEQGIESDDLFKKRIYTPPSVKNESTSIDNIAAVRGPETSAAESENANGDGNANSFSDLDELPADDA